MEGSVSCLSFPRHLQPQGEGVPTHFGGLGLVTQERIVGFDVLFGFWSIMSVTAP